jgi:small subunit ribosomal protein S8
MTTDPIADMLTRIRNALMVKKSEVILPMSKLKHEIAKILEGEGWVYKVEVMKPDNKKNKNSSFDSLRIVLKYKKSGKPTITSIKRISKPGLKVYVDKNNLPRVLNNMGIAIISTSEGMMTNKEARKRGVGGEVICEVY